MPEVIAAFAPCLIAVMQIHSVASICGNEREGRKMTV